jgi:hypothetical protein
LSEQWCDLRKRTRHNTKSSFTIRFATHVID